MTTRHANPSDAACLAAISIEVWIGTYLKSGVSAVLANYALDTFTAAVARAQIADPTQVILVSENADGIDGFFRVSFGNASPVAARSDVEIATF